MVCKDLSIDYAMPMMFAGGLWSSISSSLAKHQAYVDFRCGHFLKYPMAGS
jgi:hypothetical protein